MLRTLSSLTILFFVCICLSSFGGNNEQGEEITFIKDNQRVVNHAVQKQWRQTEAWNNFTRRNGQWMVEFNELNGLPHRAFGKPIVLNANGTLEQTLLNFLSDDLAKYQIPINDLDLTNISEFRGLTYIDFVQKHSSLEVLFSRATFRLNKNGDLIMFGLDVYNDIDISILPTISSNTAGQYATVGLLNPVQSINVESTLAILPIPGATKYDYRLVYEISVETMNDQNVPGDFYTLVDAHSGEILYRQNRVYTHIPPAIDVDLSGTLYAITPYDPATVEPLAYAKVDAIAIYFTDSAGQLNINITNPVYATFHLDGTYAKVVQGVNGTVAPFFSDTLWPGNNTISFDSFTDIVHLTTYYHTNVVHDYFKKKMGGSIVMDAQMLAKVDLTTGQCNAFYNGDINFYAQSGGCNSIGLVGDVVYHEYGHGINSKFWQSQGSNFSNGALGEGYADVWSFGISESPVIGKGFYTGSQAGIRSYGGPGKKYPDDITGQVHNDGEIIAGAWWHVGVNLGSVQQMMDLFAGHCFGTPNGPSGSEGQVYRDALMEALLVDDNDGDISNGTPNDSNIVCAFSRHGIILSTDVDSVHSELISYTANDSILIEANNAYPWYYAGMELHYRVGTGSWKTAVMSINGNKFESYIPGQSAGTIISYYLKFNDICGSSGTYPEGVNKVAPNIPYFIMIGYHLWQLEDFDNMNSGWITADNFDDAIAGLWDITSPMASYTNPGNPIPDNLVQPGEDHTANSSSNICAVTGNAITTFSFQGLADVDRGTTTLISPQFDLSNMVDPAFEYYRWFTNNTSINPGTDYWVVEISNDGGANYIKIERNLNTDRSWRHYAFRVKDYVTLTAKVKLRFVASDVITGGQNQGQSIVEAAVDDIGLYDIVAPPSSIVELDGGEFSLYPNPTNGDFYILFSESMIAQNIEIALYNSLGQRVFFQDNVQALHNKYMVHLDDIERGIYLIEINDGQKLYSKRVILLSTE